MKILYDNISANIPYVLSEVHDLIKNSQVLLTAIDSQENVADSLIIQRAIGDGVLIQKFNNYVSFPSSELYNLIDNYNLFNGFDEIWFFRNIVNVVNPPDVPLVTPYELKISDLQNIEKWMISSSCYFAIGDGCGLNYITTDEKIDQKLKKI